MANDHTAGPWLDRGGDIVAPGSWIVAEVGTGYHSHFPKEVNKANARLIAAAPDLLAACEAVEEAWSVGTQADLATAVDAVLSAVAKAKEQLEHQWVDNSYKNGMYCRVCEIEDKYDECALPCPGNLLYVESYKGGLVVAGGGDGV